MLMVIFVFISDTVSKRNVIVISYTVSYYIIYALLYSIYLTEYNFKLFTVKWGSRKNFVYIGVRFKWKLNTFFVYKERIFYHHILLIHLMILWMNWKFCSIACNKIYPHIDRKLVIRLTISHLNACYELNEVNKFLIIEVIYSKHW